MNSTKLASFKKTVWDYYHKYGRELAWRRFPRPLPAGRQGYRIVVSEIMLQQTQVDRVAPYYERFIKQFPSFAALARAPVNQVLLAWQGLGYNRRALSLQKLAQIVTEKYEGELPDTPEKLDELPGIGKGTAGSLSAFVFNKPVSFIETNIRRVFIHHFSGVIANIANKTGNNANGKIADEQLMPFIEKTMDMKSPREWYYALMDYGSHLGKKVANPNRKSEHYSKQSKFEGSNRQLRGAILRLVLREQKPTDRELLAVAGSKTKLAQVMGELRKEGFL